MKKAIILLVLLSMLFCLTSCFWNKTRLEKAGLSDFVQPDAKSHRVSNAETLYKMTKEEYDTYVQAVYDYLLAKEFAYLGTQGEVVSAFFGGSPTYRFVETSCLADFYNEEEDAYIFVMSNELSSNNILADDITITLSYHEGEEYQAKVYTIYRQVLCFYEVATESSS